MIERQEMRCAYCGSAKRWPDDFPNRWLAECSECTLAHGDEHRESLRRGRFYAALTVLLMLVLMFVVCKGL